MTRTVGNTAIDARSGLDRAVKGARNLIAWLLLVTAAAWPGQALAQSKVDWPTYGFDNARSGHNPNETLLNTSTIGQLTLKWTAQMQGLIMTQPLLAANVTGAFADEKVDLVYAGDAAGNFAAFNAASGAAVWTRYVPPQPITQCNGTPGTVGFQSTPVLDRANNAIYVAAPNGIVYALNLATGAILWAVRVTTIPSTEAFWSGLALYQGQLYITIAGADCDTPPYNGRIVDIDTASKSIANTWYTTGANGPGGGGIWSWGGVSIDQTTGDVLTSTGNALGDNEKFGYGEAMVRLDKNLNVLDFNQPPVYGTDIDFGSTPTLYTPPGCAEQTAVVNKSGEFLVYDANSLAAGAIQAVMIADPSAGVVSGVVAYDPASNSLIMTNNQASPDGTFGAGILVFPIVGCSLQSPRQYTSGFAQQNGYFPPAPPTIANGLIYASTGAAGQFFVLDEATGQQRAATPAGWVTDGAYNAVSVVNGQVYLTSLSGVLYAFGLPAQ
jgi:outer membrane protein assembly factor BamB